MNILYFMRYWPIYGGGETVTATLANEFVKRGHNVTIAYTFRNDVHPQPYNLSILIKEVQTYTIEKYNKGDVLSLNSILKDNKIDVVINQWGDTSLIRKAIDGLSCKLVTCWHLDVFRDSSVPKSVIKKYVFSILPKFYEYYDRKKQIRNHKINQQLSDKYIFLSDSFVLNYQKSIPGSNNNLEAVSNPLTYDFKYNIDNYNSKKKQLLFVGRIYEYHKRLTYILKTWKEISSDSLFKDWNLCIVGDGPDMQEIKNQAERLSLTRIAFEGFKDPKPYYNESSIFLMTSSFEGFGMTLVEAQQFGVVPVVMDTYSSLHDIIEHDKNGIIVEDNNLDEYVSEVKNLMKDYDYRKALAKLGLQTCEKFLVDRIAAKWEGILSDLVIK